MARHRSFYIGLTESRRSVLWRAARKNPPFSGTALMYEQQFGKIRQVNWLCRNGYVRQSGGRLVATRKGQAALASEQRPAGERG